MSYKAVLEYKVPFKNSASKTTTKMYTAYESDKIIV